MPESDLGKRLWNAGEGLIFGVIFAGIYWLLGLIIKAITGKGGYANRILKLIGKLYKIEARAK